MLSHTRKKTWYNDGSQYMAKPASNIVLLVQEMQFSAIFQAQFWQFKPDGTRISTHVRCWTLQIKFSGNRTNTLGCICSQAWKLQFLTVSRHSSDSLIPITPIFELSLDFPSVKTQAKFCRNWTPGSVMFTSMKTVLKALFRQFAPD